MNKLPEKWRIKDSIIVSKWASETFKCINTVSTNYLCVNMRYFPERTSYNFFGNRAEYTEYTEITLEDFKKFILKEKTMTKQDFTIEGSEALKKAFVEECGVPTLSKESLTRNYLCPTSDNKSLQSSGAYKLPKHFVLPKDWDSALEYVKEFFKEEEIKKGDYVVVLSKKSYNYGHSSGNEKPVIGRTYEVTNTIGNLINLYSPTGWIRIDAEELRKATPEEIKASKTVSFKLGEHTAVVTKDKVEIAGRGSVSISECIEWFQKEFIADNDDYSSLGEFVVKENTYTLDIGCVKNVPVKDIEALYKYLKTL